MSARQEITHEHYNANCWSHRLGTRSLRLCGYASEREFKAGSIRGGDESKLFD